MSAARQGRRTLVQLFKQGCDEIPEIMGSSAGGLVGIGIIGYALYYYNKHELWNRRFKFLPTVVRPEDPRAQNLRTD